MKLSASISFHSAAFRINRTVLGLCSVNDYACAVMSKIVNLTECRDDGAPEYSKPVRIKSDSKAPRSSSHTTCTRGADGASVESIAPWELSLNGRLGGLPLLEHLKYQPSTSHMA